MVIRLAARPFHLSKRRPPLHPRRGGATTTSSSATSGPGSASPQTVGKSWLRLASSARRWVVERTHSWLNRFRGLLIRCSKKPDNHRALLQLACGLITWRMATAENLPG
jgi:transposase